MRRGLAGCGPVSAACTERVCLCVCGGLEVSCGPQVASALATTRLPSPPAAAAFASRPLLVPLPLHLLPLKQVAADAVSLRRCVHNLLVSACTATNGSTAFANRGSALFYSRRPL